MTVLTQFDVFSAARIAKAVRTVEDMKPAAKPLTFRRVPDEPGRRLRQITWAENWLVGDTSVITFKVSEATATATNNHMGVGPGEGFAALSSGAWRLVSFDWTKLDNFDNSTSTATVQILGSRGGIAMWFNRATCA